MPQQIQNPANETEIALQRVLSKNGAPVDGTDGDGFAPKGMLLIDYSAGDLYINTGDASASVWKKITRAV